jgi:ribosomal protein S6
MDAQKIFSGDIPSEFKDLLKKGNFTSKTKIESGDIVEFVYNGERKYAFIINPNYLGHIHAVNLKYLTNQQLIKLIQELVKTNGPQMLYENIKTLVKDTRSYRTYSVEKVTRTRILKYEPLIG